MADNTHSNSNTFGDTAVDGLLAGGLAGVGMGLYLLLAGLTWGDSPVVTLGRFDPGGAGAPAAGLLAHLAVSAVYGAVFALVWRLALRRSRLPIWAAAVAYGLLLWVLAAGSLLPAAVASLIGIPPVHFAFAHGAYGLILGLALNRRR